MPRLAYTMVAKLKIKMNAAQFEHRFDYYFTGESSLLLIYCKKLFILQASFRNIILWLYMG